MKDLQATCNVTQNHAYDLRQNIPSIFFPSPQKSKSKSKYQKPKTKSEMPCQSPFQSTLEPITSLHVKFAIYLNGQPQRPIFSKILSSYLREDACTARI